MRGFETASVHYCSHLGKNVIFENFYNSEEVICRCWCREQCRFSEYGCRSGLYSEKLSENKELT